MLIYVKTATKWESSIAHAICWPLQPTAGASFSLSHRHKHAHTFTWLSNVWRDFSEGFIFAQSQVNSETESCIKLVTAPSSMHKGLA